MSRGKSYRTTTDSENKVTKVLTKKKLYDNIDKVINIHFQ